jgi:DNA-binding NtrC family response regulator
VHGLQVKGVTEETLKRLKDYHWPGNIRELKNVLEHAFIMESSDQLGIESLPDYFLNHQKECAQGTSSYDKKNEHSLNSEIENFGTFIDTEEIEDGVFSEQEQESKFHHSEQTYSFQFHFDQDKVEGFKFDFQEAKDYFEKEFIKQALKYFKGRINQTALKANIPKKTLLRKIEKYRINPKEFYL